MVSTSAPVKVTVYPPPAPKVVIVNPRNGRTIPGAPRNIEVSAIESNFTNPIVNVRFFDGAGSIGTSTNSPFSSIVWSNVPPGAYTLTAVATDMASIMATSPPVNITVITNQPPSWWWGD